MDVKYQVFVSSTFIDLQEERRSVIEAILNIGHIPVGMEAFQASDDTQWEYIKRRIDESDYYIVIVGERYGSEQKGKSYTQMEYEYAAAQNVPVSAFLLDAEIRKSWPSDKVEFDKKEKVDKFRRLCQKKLVKFWKNSDDLGAKVSAALYELMREKPQIGWVRADSMPSEMVLEELSRLSEEKRILQTKVDELSKNNTELVIPAKATWLMDELKSKRIIQYCSEQDIETELDNDILSVFWDLHKEFAKGVRKWEAHHDLAMSISGLTNPPRDTQYVAESIYDELLVADLIENYVEQTHPFDKPVLHSCYRLTDYGKQFVMYIKEFGRRREAE